MYRYSKVYGDTSPQAITRSASQPIGTAGTSNTVYACIGEATVYNTDFPISGERKLSMLAQARRVLMDRVRNVAKDQLIVRVEAYPDDNDSTFFSDVGLTDDNSVSCGFKLTDSDQAQATQLLDGALSQILQLIKEDLESGQLSITP